MRDVDAKSRRRLRPKIAEDATDEVFQRIATTENFGAVEVTDGEVTLERLNEAAWALDLCRVAMKITFNSGRAGEGFGCSSPCSLMLFEIEQGAEGRRGSSESN